MTPAYSLSLILSRLDEIERKLDCMLQELQAAVVTSTVVVLKNIGLMG
jgi:tetrahydromethanopterin S-methyltransferase subunit G